MSKHGFGPIQKQCARCPMRMMAKKLALKQKSVNFVLLILFAGPKDRKGLHRSKSSGQARI